MTNTFVIGDTHFTQPSVLTFKRNDGTPLREFSCIEDHDEYIVQQWNKTVRPQDKIYHLGDVVMHKRALDIVARLNGHKRLVMGNHDVYQHEEYLKHFEGIVGYNVVGQEDYLKDFEKIMSCRVLSGMILTHIPIHPDCVARFKVNVHGHLHSNIIDDPRYINVSCEQVGYTPVSIDELKI